MVSLSEDLSSMLSGVEQRRGGTTTDTGRKIIFVIIAAAAICCSGCIIPFGIIIVTV